MDDTSGPAGELVGKADKPLVKKSKKRLNGTQSDSTAGTQSDSIDATPSSSNASAPSFSDAAKDKVEATQLYIDPGDIEATYQTVTASKVYTTSSSVNDSSNEIFHLSTRENLKITEASLPDLKGDTINLSANNDSITIRQLAQCTGTNGWRVEKDESLIDDDASLDIVHKIAIASANKLSSNKTVEFNDTNSETDSVVSSVQESSMSDVAIMPISGKEIEFTTVRKKKKVKTLPQGSGAHDFVPRGGDSAYGSVNSYGFKKSVNGRYPAYQGAGGGGSRTQFEGGVRHNFESSRTNIIGARTMPEGTRHAQSRTTKVHPVESSSSTPSHITNQSGVVDNSVECSEINTPGVILVSFNSGSSCTTGEPIFCNIAGGSSYAKMVGDPRDSKPTISSFGPANFPTLPTSASSVRRNSTGNVEPEIADEPRGSSESPSETAASVKFPPSAISYASIAKSSCLKSGALSVKIDMERRRSLESGEIELLPLAATQLNFPPIGGSIAVCDTHSSVAVDNRQRRAGDVTSTSEKCCDETERCGRCADSSGMSAGNYDNIERSDDANRGERKRKVVVRSSLVYEEQCGSSVTLLTDLKLLGDDQSVDASPFQSSGSTVAIDINEDSKFAGASSKLKPNATTTVRGSTRSSGMQSEPVVFLDIRNHRQEQSSSKEIGISFGFDASESVDSGLGDICTSDVAGCNDIIFGASGSILSSNVICLTRCEESNAANCIASNAVTAPCGSGSCKPNSQTLAATAVFVGTSNMNTDTRDSFAATLGISAQPDTIVSLPVKCIKCQHETDSGIVPCNTDTATSPILACEYEAAIHGGSATDRIAPHTVTSEDFIAMNVSRSLGGYTPSSPLVGQPSHSRPIALMSGTSSTQGPRAPVGVVPPLHFDRSKPIIENQILKDGAYFATQASQPIDSYAEKALLNENDEKLCNTSVSRGKVVQLQSNSRRPCGATAERKTGNFDLSGAQLFFFKGR